MAQKPSGATAPVQKGPTKGNPGKTNENMKSMGRGLAKVAAQKRGG
jgi:hypothetical protein